MKTQTYKLEFCGDEMLYSISFKGRIPSKEAEKLLWAVHDCLYKKMAGKILSYLRQQNLNYSDFVSREIPLKHDVALRATDRLLHADSCDWMDAHTGSTDFYFAVTDCQKWVRRDYYEGCYWAAAKTPLGQMGHYRYRVIGQTFCSDISTDSEGGYFAIRSGRNGGCFCNLDTAAGELVIPAFGCVDLMALLPGMDAIRTAEQVRKAVLK